MVQSSAGLAGLDGLDGAFAALADGTRRGILDTLEGGDASISDLAEAFAMTLTGMKKHVAVLEGVGLVETEKVGRVRRCRLGRRRLDEVGHYLERHRRRVEARYRRLDAVLADMAEAPDPSPAPSPAPAPPDDD